MLPITLTIAAAAALINLWLAFRAERLRMSRRIMLGDGGDEGMRARMRAQANFVEYTPFFLILLGLIEMAKGSRTWLWGVSIAYVLARIVHAFGMDSATPSKLRAGGILVTWAVLLGLALYALTIPYAAGVVTTTVATPA